MNNRILKPLFETSEVKKIKFSSKPFPVWEDIIELSVEEFQKVTAKRRNLPVFLYTESLSVPDWFEVENADFSVFQNINPANKLIVCDMGETGLGVFTGAPIKKGEVVAVYTGSVETTKQDDHYLMMNFNYDSTPENLNEIMETSLNEREGLINPIYSGEKEGGLASFMQSLPDVNRLQCADMKHLITTANLTQKINFFTSTAGKKIGLVSLVANRDINEGEQIGFDYGDQYFEHFEIEEMYFDKTNGNAYPYQMIDFPDGIFKMLLESIINKDLSLARDILCSLHPHILDILCKLPSKYSIKETLLEIASFKIKIENETLKEMFDNYKHISAMHFLKFNYQFRLSDRNKQIRVSNNRNAFNSPANTTVKEDASLSQEKDHKSENAIPVVQYLNNIQLVKK